MRIVHTGPPLYKPFTFHSIREGDVGGDEGTAPREVRQGGLASRGSRNRTTALGLKPELKLGALQTNLWRKVKLGLRPIVHLQVGRIHWVRPKRLCFGWWAASYREQSEQQLGALLDVRATPVRSALVSNAGPTALRT